MDLWRLQCRICTSIRQRTK